MTLVLALAARDGVVLVADGQAVGGSGQLVTRSRAEKLSNLHERIAYGCAGSAGLRQRVVQELESRISQEDCGEDISLLRPRLLAAVNEVQQQGAGEHVRRTLMSEADGIQVLFAGVSDDGGPWIYEVTEDGGDEVHFTAEAIGSGRPYARYALMSAEHHRLRERGLDQVRLLAYRAVDDAIRTDATDLGGPISLYVVTRERAAALTEVELDEVGHAVAVWQGHEAEIFGLMGNDANGLRRPGAGGGTTGIDPPPERS